MYTFNVAEVAHKRLCLNTERKPEELIPYVQCIDYKHNFNFYKKSQRKKMFRCLILILNINNPELLDIRNFLNHFISVVLEGTTPEMCVLHGCC